VSYRDYEGRRVQKSLKEADKQKARKLKKHYDAVEKISFLEGRVLQRNIQLHDWIGEYRKRRKNRIARSTYLREGQALRSLEKAVKNKLINKIKTVEIEEWYDGLLENGKTATANCLLRHIKVFFNVTVRAKYLNESPCMNVRAVKEVKKKVRVLTEAEIKSVLKVMPPRWRELVKTAIFTGARSGEISRLKAEDINLNSDFPNIMIKSTQNNPTKSKKSRTVPLPASSQSFFKKILQGKKRSDFLLCNPHSCQWTVGWISRGWKKYCKLASVHNCTFHDLRRTYGAWLVMKGADLVTVQDNLGHSDIKVTIEHYVHLQIKHRAEQTDKFPDLNF
jgi:integrase